MERAGQQQNVLWKQAAVGQKKNTAPAPGIVPFGKNNSTNGQHSGRVTEIRTSQKMVGGGSRGGAGACAAGTNAAAFVQRHLCRSVLQWVIARKHTHAPARARARTHAHTHVPRARARARAFPQIVACIVPKVHQGEVRCLQPKLDSPGNWECVVRGGDSFLGRRVWGR
eukprot:gene17529-biopygen5344